MTDPEFMAELEHRLGQPHQAPRSKLLVIRALAQRDGTWCAYCGVLLRLPPRRHSGAARRRHLLPWVTVDHVVPTSRGGTEDLTNKALACALCNTVKGDALPVGRWRPTANVRAHLLVAEHPEHAEMVRADWSAAA